MTWISVKERLPDCNGKFLVHKMVWNSSIISTLYFAKDGEKICEYDLKGAKDVWYDYDCEWGYFSVDSVTHWMPLPEPPKEDV